MCAMCEKDFLESSSTGKRQPRDEKHGKVRFHKKGINMHKLGEAFVGEVLQVRKGTATETAQVYAEQREMSGEDSVKIKHQIDLNQNL